MAEVAEVEVDGSETAGASAMKEAGQAEHMDAAEGSAVTADQDMLGYLAGDPNW